MMWVKTTICPFFGQIKTIEIMDPKRDPRTNAFESAIGKFKVEFKITPRLGVSVPKIEIVANESAFSWALANGKINCNKAKGNDNDKIIIFIEFWLRSKSNNDKAI